MSIYMVLNGLHVCINVVRYFMIMGHMSWMSHRDSRNMMCGDMDRNVSGTCVTSWQNMGVLNVGVCRTVCCAHVSTGDKMGMGWDMFGSVFSGITSMSVD